MFFLSLNMKFLLNIRNSLQQQQQPASQPLKSGPKERSGLKEAVIGRKE
jgi:hypothetical protein